MKLMDLVSRAREAVNQAQAAIDKIDWSQVRRKAIRTLTAMADGAENFLGHVKKAWQVAKPVVLKVRPFLETWIAVDGRAAWVVKTLTTLFEAVDHLLALENSEVAAAVEKAMKWVAARLRDLARDLDAEEALEAEAASATLRKNRDSVRPEHMQGVRLAEIVVQLDLLRARLRERIEADQAGSFDDYLKLRAIQKLASQVEISLGQATSATDVSDEDRFVLEAALDMLSDDPRLDDAAIARLDAVIRARVGSGLDTLVFNELILAWDARQRADRQAWKEKASILASKQVDLETLTMMSRIKELSASETAEQQALAIVVANLEAEVKSAAEKQRSLRYYIEAAEGFLETLEKTSAQLEAEGSGFMVNRADQVGELIFECGRNGKRWSDLSPDERALITDYANIFREASADRIKKLQEVEVTA